jgi:DNA-binding XRE family transcriptional regulator
MERGMCVVALPFWKMTAIIPKPMKIITLCETSYIRLHILKQRLELGMWQKDVATLLGIKVVALYEWENEKVNPSGIYSANIIRFLGTILILLKQKL